MLIKLLEEAHLPATEDNEHDDAVNNKQDELTNKKQINLERKKLCKEGNGQQKKTPLNKEHTLKTFGQQSFLLLKSYS